MSDEAKIIVTLESSEKKYNQSDFGVSMDSTNEEILDAVAPSIREEFEVDIKDNDEYIFTVTKAQNSGNIFVFPKSLAGTL